MFKRYIFLFSFLFFFSCSNSIDNEKDVFWLGRYDAVKLYVIDTLENIDMDMIENGATFNIELKDNNVFTTTLFLPDSLAAISVEDSSALDEDGTLTVRLNGTYVYSMNTNRVTFEHEEDFFVRNLKWILKDNVLSSHDTTGGRREVDGVVIQTPITVFDIKMIKQ